MKALIAALLLATAAMTSHAIEEPDFEVVQRLDAVEIRQYAPYVVAEVTVTGPADSAGNRAFPLLAGYIFGKNKGERKMAMTAPVTQAPVAVMKMVRSDLAASGVACTL
ncbi:MAG: heme-binding protein, partial [Rubrivivax sp.]